jgi:DNA/RNA-binding domain of Phe-tRNA-synthetase-like protein
MQIDFTEKIINALNINRLGVFIFNCSVKNSTEDLWAEIDEYSHTLSERLQLEEVNKIETIASARNAYKKCGKDPNRYRPSADSLIRRIVKGNELYKVNNVVDILNFISIQSGFSIGGYDTSKIVGNIKMDIGTPEDMYAGIGRGDLNIDGLPVLRDSVGVFGSPTSDSERTSITLETTTCAFVFFDFGVSVKLEQYLELSIFYLKTYADGNNFDIQQFVVNKS